MHPNAHALANHLLEWTAVRFEADSLTVEAKFPDQVWTNFGIALGRRTSHKVFGPTHRMLRFFALKSRRRYRANTRLVRAGIVSGAEEHHATSGAYY